MEATLWNIALQSDPERPPHTLIAQGKILPTAFIKKPSHG